MGDRPWLSWRRHRGFYWTSTRFQILFTPFSWYYRRGQRRGVDFRGLSPRVAYGLGVKRHGDILVTRPFLPYCCARGKPLKIFVKAHGENAIAILIVIFKYYLPQESANWLYTNVQKVVMTKMVNKQTNWSRLSHKYHVKLPKYLSRNSRKKF